MLLTITTTHRPASDLSFLLHKHPDRFQSFPMSFGQAHVYYTEANDERCTACLLLDVDPVGLVRKPDASFALGQYVNDRPYVATSFMSTAIAQVFGSALNGHLKTRPDLPQVPMPWEVTIDVLPIRGGEPFLRSIFEPLGYGIELIRHPLDPHFPDWGDSHYYRLTLLHKLPLAMLLSHLFVLIPVFDGQKHYFIDEHEIEKLLAKGEGWLADHPAREAITQRYLGRRMSLVRQALARLSEDEPPDANEEKETQPRPIRLNEQRITAVVDALKATGARSILDLGCGEGKLIRELLPHQPFERIVGMDVSIRALEIAHRRLGFNRVQSASRGRVQYLHGSLMYADDRLKGFDAAAVVEVIEHLDPPRLAAFERVVFERAQPTHVILTTPNRDYNPFWESLTAGEFRHSDHRFEWSRSQFQTWSNGIAMRFGYAVRFEPIGPIHDEFGSPTQMAIFTKSNAL